MFCRNLRHLTITVGFFANEFVNHALKNHFQQARPPTCELLGVCDTYGFPSSHAQCTLYFVAMRLLVRPPLPVVSLSPCLPCCSARVLGVP